MVKMAVEVGRGRRGGAGERGSTRRLELEGFEGRRRRHEQGPTPSRRRNRLAIPAGRYGGGDREVGRGGGGGRGGEGGGELWGREKRVWVKQERKESKSQKRVEMQRKVKSPV